MRGLHVVVQDLQVRAQDQPRLARQRHAGQALAHIGPVAAGRDARIGIRHRVGAALGQGQGLDLAHGLGGLQVGVRLLVQLAVRQQQQRGLPRTGARALQRDVAALQVVAGARGNQRLGISGT